jgi:hypothetical protein
MSVARAMQHSVATCTMQHSNMHHAVLQPLPPARWGHPLPGLALSTPPAVPFRVPSGSTTAITRFGVYTRPLIGYGLSVLRHQESPWPFRLRVATQGSPSLFRYCLSRTAVNILGPHWHPSHFNRSARRPDVDRPMGFPTPCVVVHDASCGPCPYVVRDHILPIEGFPPGIPVSMPSKVWVGGSKKDR